MLNENELLTPPTRAQRASLVGAALETGASGHPDSTSTPISARPGQLALDPGTYLGPARVHQVAGNRVQLEFPDERPWALVALAYPYRPAAGDLVLAAGQNQNWYIIGVLQGQGRTTFMVPGDFEVLAPRGRISFLAGKGMHLKSPEVKITAGKLELVARRLTEHFTDATRWVKDTMRLRAGRSRTEVEHDYQLKAGRISERAERDVRIDGEKINLG